MVASPSVNDGKQPQKRSWNWIEKIFEKIPVSYSFVSVIAAFVFCIIYFFLMSKKYIIMY
jgi:hypothetical protein